ncbi:MAG: hypothetical protein IJ087_00920 [Eggerthellaceae bacterium]|nr:hypothetical protein [Eggerthellaceae bacterium]
MRINEIAAAIHADMCNDEGNGYSWEERNGNPADPKTLWFDGMPYTYNRGDRDCSASYIEAWALAVQYTPYAGCFDAATYTGNIRSVFQASGLFEVWDTASTTAQVGDGYLNDENHVAMCQSVEPDLLSEFSWGDNGAYGNRRGDQSGWESHICEFYDYPWWCTLHYNGKADGTVSGEPVEAPQPQTGGYQLPPDREWQGDVVGLEDTTGCGEDFAGVPGRPIIDIAIDGVGKYQVSDIDSDGFWPIVDHYDLGDPEDGYAGNDRPVDGLRIFDPSVHYQLHKLGFPVDEGWHEPMVGTRDTSSVGDDYAGEQGVQHDLVRIWRDGGAQPRYNVFS